MIEELIKNEKERQEDLISTFYNSINDFFYKNISIAEIERRTNGYFEKTTIRQEIYGLIDKLPEHIKKQLISTYKLELLMKNQQKKCIYLYSVPSKFVQKHLITIIEKDKENE